MSKVGKETRRTYRKSKNLKHLKRRLSQLKTILRMAGNCPDLQDFIGSLDTSGFTRLLGIFFCPEEEYLDTETVLQRSGYTGYQTLQCEIRGDRPSTPKGAGRGWTAPVKREGEQDRQYKVFIGIVRRAGKGTSSEDMVARWMEVASAAHEFGHAHDMDQGITFQIGKPFEVVEAECYAHTFACKLLSSRGMIMGLTAYLSSAVCSVLNDTCKSVAEAARRFLASEEYRRYMGRIPAHVRRQFKLIPPP